MHQQLFCESEHVHHAPMRGLELAPGVGFIVWLVERWVLMTAATNEGAEPRTLQTRMFQAVVRPMGVSG